MATKSDDNVALTILPISEGVITFCVVGTTPLIFNRMSSKAKRALLLGGTRKTKAEQAENLKHDPIAEYRDSVYRNPGNAFPTRLKFPGDALRKAISSAALDIPGARKSEIGRLTNLHGLFNVNVYGVPRINMSVVRNSDMNHTPDVRSRAILPEWCMTFDLHFVRPKLTERAIGNLMAAAGIVVGIGDWRQEKGSGSYGAFRLVEYDDADFERIKRTGGIAEQDAALLAPEAYDDETAELLDWYYEEILRRGREKEAAHERPKAKRKTATTENRVLS